MKKPADHPASNAAATPAPKSYKGAEIMVEYLIKEKVPYLFVMRSAALAAASRKPMLP